MPVNVDESHANCVILRISGHIDVYNTKDLWDAVTIMQKTVPKHVLLDLKDLRFIDSAGFGLLIRMNEATKDHGRTFGLFGLTESLDSVFVGLLRTGVFSLFADEQAALLAISSSLEA